MTARLSAQLISALVVGVLLIVAGLWVRDRWQELQGLRGYKAEAETMHESTEAISGNLEGALGAQRDDAAGVLGWRAADERAYEELKNAHDDVAAWADTPIPDELRQLDRARRLSVDGPAPDRVGREGAD